MIYRACKKQVTINWATPADYIMDIFSIHDVTKIRLQQCHLSQLLLSLNSAVAFQTKNAWKFPGGLSDPGENIGESHSTEQRMNTVHLAKSFHFSIML